MLRTAYLSPTSTHEYLNSYFVLSMLVIELNPDCDFQPLVRFLTSVSGDFAPPLIERTSISAFAIRILPPQGFAFGIKQGDELVGVAGIELLDASISASAFRVLAVAEKVRGSTNAVRLMRRAMLEFEQNAGDVLWAKTWHTNALSVRLMKHFGFVYQHEIQNARGDGIHEVHYLWKKPDA